MLSISLITSLALATPFDSNYTFDSAATRGLLLPTAQTLKKGDFTLSSIELILVNANYGITDNFSLQFTTLLPVFPVGFGGQLSGRIKLLESEKFIVSLEPSALIGSGDSGLSTTFGGGIISDYSIGDGGRFLITGSLNTQTLSGFSATGEDFGINDGVLGIAGLGAQILLAKNFKLMGEFLIPLGYSQGEFAVAQEVTLLNFGVRRMGEYTWDLSIVRPLSVSEGWFILPYLSVTRRFELSPKLSSSK